MIQRANLRYGASAGLSGGEVRHRFAPLRGYVGWRILFSPATAFALAVVGTYAFAGFVNRIDPEGSTGSVLVRVAIVLVTVGSYALLPVKLRSSTAALLPMKIFAIVYLCRLIENFFLSGIYFSPGPRMVFSIFIVSGIGTALLISSMEREIRDKALIVSMNTLCIVFIIGLILNKDLLMQVSGNDRLSLDKINPISMGHTAIAFIIFFAIAAEKTRKLTLYSIVLCPVLFIVAVWARSRGAYIAGVGSLLIYALLLKGSRRVFVVVGAVAIALAILASSGAELIDIVIARLQTIDPNADQSTMTRNLLFAGAWRQFQENPLVGRYAVERLFNFYPHNIYLESLMSVGVFGSLPFAAHIILALRSTVGIIRSGKFPLAAVLTSVLFIREAIAGMASGSLWGNSLFWVSSALTISFWYGYQGFLHRSRNLENQR